MTLGPGRDCAIRFCEQTIGTARNGSSDLGSRPSLSLSRSSWFLPKQSITPPSIHPLVLTQTFLVSSFCITNKTESSAMDRT